MVSLNPFSGPPSVPPGSARSFLARVRNPLWSMAALVVVIWGIKEAATVLVPITFAGMLAMICSPAVKWLEQRRIPNVVAVLAVVAGMVVGIGVIGALVTGSVSGFTDSIPMYVTAFRSMIAEATVIAGGYGFALDPDKLLGVVDPGKAATQAMTVVSRSMNALLSALSNTFLVVLTMVLMLMEGKTVPAKLRALSGDEDADISHFRRIAEQVQSYLAIKTLLSLATGALVGVWAAVLDVDFALLWGLLAFLLNYIPNIGSILAAVPAMLLALIQHGVGVSLGLGAGYVVVNMVLGNVVEPMWMGRKLGLSTTVVFLSLAIWYEIWGPVGMFLSVPLTMVIKIMLAHSKEYAAIAQLLDTGEPHHEPAVVITAVADGDPDEPVAQEAVAEQTELDEEHDEPPDTDPSLS
jgi:predicted PurR-regulated permease PerM